MVEMAREAARHLCPDSMAADAWQRGRDLSRSLCRSMLMPPLVSLKCLCHLVRTQVLVKTTLVLIIGISSVPCVFKPLLPGPCVPCSPCVLRGPSFSVKYYLNPRTTLPGIPTIVLHLIHLCRWTL